MSEATCFNCGKVLGVGKPMEELLEDRFPVFCCVLCSTEFPDNHTPEFEQKLKDLHSQFQNKENEVSKNG